MMPRSRSFAGTVFVTVLALQLVVLAGGLGAVRFLLAREVEADIKRQGEKYLRVLAAAVSLYGATNVEGLPEAIRNLEAVSGMPAAVARDSHVLYRSPRIAAAYLPVQSEPVRTGDGALYSAVSALHGGFEIAAFVPREPFDRLLAQLTWWILVCSLGGIVVSALAARVTATRLAAPIQRLASAASAIELTSLDAPVDEHHYSFRELQVMARAFNEMLHRLDGAVNRLRRFMAEASHELRTPVATLKTVAQVAAADPAVSADAVALAGRQLSHITRLERLVDGMLLLSKLEVGASDKAPVDFSDVVRETAEWLRPVAEVRDVRLCVAAADPVTVIGDRGQLASLVTNLIENSVKYTDAGGTVRVSLHQSQGTAVLDVRDSGGGILAADHDLVFEPFYRVDRSRSRDTGGAGLGLAIVRRVAVAHGGEVSVTSPAEGGSAFSVVLPAT